MANNRIGRINEDIQRELSALIRTLKDPRVSQVGMVSVIRVDTTGDLRYARIYISVLDKNQEKDVMKGLKSPPASCAGNWPVPCSCATPRSCSSSPTTPSCRAPTFWRSCGIPIW